MVIDPPLDDELCRLNPLKPDIFVNWVLSLVSHGVDVLPRERGGQRPDPLNEFALRHFQPTLLFDASSEALKRPSGGGTTENAPELEIRVGQLDVSFS